MLRQMHVENYHYFDALLRQTRGDNYHFDIKISFLKTLFYPLGLIAIRRLEKPLRVNSRCLGESEINYISDVLLSRAFAEEHNFNSLLMLRNQLSSHLNIMLRGIAERYHSIGTIMRGACSSTHKMDLLAERAHFRNYKYNEVLSSEMEHLFSINSIFRGENAQYYNFNSITGKLNIKNYPMNLLAKKTFSTLHNINSFLKVLTETQFGINSYLEKTLLVNYAHSPFLTGLKVRCFGVDIYLTKRPFNIEIYNDSFTSLSWCSRWDEENWSVIIEIIADREARDAIRQHITPGAVAELYNILGEPRYIDTTYSSGNTIWLKGRRGLFNLRDPTKIAVKNYSEKMLPDGRFLIKLEGYKL